MLGKFALDAPQFCGWNKLSILYQIETSVLLDIDWGFYLQLIFFLTVEKLDDNSWTQPSGEKNNNSLFITIYIIFVSLFTAMVKDDVTTSWRHVLNLRCVHGIVGNFVSYISAKSYQNWSTFGKAVTRKYNGSFFLEGLTGYVYNVYYTDIWPDVTVRHYTYELNVNWNVIQFRQ